MTDYSTKPIPPDAIEAAGAGLSPWEPTEEDRIRLALRDAPVVSPPPAPRIVDVAAVYGPALGRVVPLALLALGLGAMLTTWWLAAGGGL